MECPPFTFFARRGLLRAWCVVVIVWQAGEYDCGMGLRTSVYLSDELAAMWRASGVPLAEVIRRGLSAGGPVDEVTLRHVLREELAGLTVAAPGSHRGYEPGYDEYEPA